VLGTYRDRRDAGYKDAHHIIQNAAVSGIEEYNRYDAPATYLTGPAN